MSLRPAQLDFRMQRGTYGAKGAIVFQCLQADGVTPMPLTGATISLETTNIMPVIKKSTADGTLTIDTQTSTVSWEPTEAEVASIPRGRWTSYFVEILYPNMTDGFRFMEGYLVGQGK